MELSQKNKAIQPSFNIKEYQDKLLSWFEQYKRTLPWREDKNNKMTPYHTWLSEIMLQQTTVPTVIPYFQKFTQRWPSIKDLSTAELDDVLSEWAGLGYYTRARKLHECAQYVVKEFNGVFPSDYKTLISLPGIGDYTAAAISSIAFNQVETVIDGNVKRVLSRLFAVNTPSDKLHNALYPIAKELTSPSNPGNYAQALMDLGSAVCKPKKPLCDFCPIQTFCVSYNQNSQEMFPVKAVKKPKPKKHATAFLISNHEDKIYFKKRPNHGLLGGMLEIPCSPWGKNSPDLTQEERHSYKPLDVIWKSTDEQVRHIFTHFELTLDISVAKISNIDHLDGYWYSPDEIHEIALPTLMKKIVITGLKNL